MAKAKSKHSSNLITALKFVNLTGANFCSIGDNLVSAFTENFAMGFPIEEDLVAQANIKYLLKSLLKANEHATITQLDLNKLHVNSEGLEVYVNCEKQQMHVKPDNPEFPIDIQFAIGLETVLPICGSFGDHIAMKTVLVKANSFFTTNRYCLVQYWHGLNIPDFIVAKKFCDLILKTKKEATAIGISKNSVTVYFKDGAWIMGRNFVEGWIDPNNILKYNCNFEPISEEFQNALRAVPGFSESGMVYCGPECLQSHPEIQQGASYAVPGLPEGAVYGSKELEYLGKHGEQICFDGKTLYFTGKNLIGAISSR